MTSGELTASRPQTRDKKVMVILVYQQPAPSEILAYLEETKTRLAKDGIEFVWGEKANVAAMADAP